MNLHLGPHSKDDRGPSPRRRPQTRPAPPPPPSPYYGAQPREDYFYPPSPPPPPYVQAITDWPSYLGSIGQPYEVEHPDGEIEHPHGRVGILYSRTGLIHKRISRTIFREGVAATSMNGAVLVPDQM